MDRLTAKDFEKSLEEYAAEFRVTIEARVSGFDPDPKARAARIERAAEDFGFFARTYFPHHLRDADTIRPSVFHEWLIENLPQTIGSKDAYAWAIAAPRAESKSTYLLIFALWLVVRDLKHYQLYIADSYEQAAIQVEAFKAELEHNPRLKMDYPKVFGRGRVWREGECITANNIKMHARGAGQKIRGLKHGPYRPDVAYLDDIENDEHVRTPAQRDKLQDWLNKAVENLGEAGAKFDIFYVGTILHYDSVLARTQKNKLWRAKTFKAIIQPPANIDLWEEWEEILRNEGIDAADAFYAANTAAMEEGAVVSWPDKRPLELLMKTKLRVGARAFNSEFQNTPANDNGAFSKIVYWVRPLETTLYFGAVDPSMGKSDKSGDPSAIVVGRYDKTGHPETGGPLLQAVYAGIKRRTPKMIIEETIRLQKEFRCLAWAFESVQFQEFLRTELIGAAAEKNVVMPARAVPQTTNKTLRILSTSIPMEDGNIQLHPSQTTLIEQYGHFGEPGVHDDGPDAMQMLYELAVTFTGSIGGLAGGARTMDATTTFGGLSQGGILNGLRGF